MYLFIFEDMEIKKGTAVMQGDFDAVDAGILDIIDISKEEPLKYYDGKWHDLESAD